MKDVDRFVELWNEYLEGELDESGLSELQGLIEGDEHLLKMAADSFQTHRLLGAFAHDTPSQRESFIKDTLARLPEKDDRFVEEVMQHLPSTASQGKGSPGKSLLKWLVPLAAAASILLLINLVFMLQRNNGDIARITKMNGTVRWTGNGGRVVPSITVGSSLTGGTLECMSSDSWVDLAFKDGSTVTLSGQSRLTISEHDQKKLHLRSGSLSADVTPQPDGRQMVILTPTAKLDVLGTQLNVAAEQASTKLNVNKGRVRLTRLVDGTSVDVPASHQIVASMDRRAELKAISRPKPVASWQGDLIENRSYGKVRPNGHLRSDPFLYHHKGKSIILHSVSLSVYSDQTAPVQLGAGGKIVVRGRIKTSCWVWCAITTKHINGGFTGRFVIEKYFKDVPKEGCPLDLEIPIEAFRPHEKELTERFPKIFPVSAVGLELLDWSCCTIDENAELEISHVSLKE